MTDPAKQLKIPLNLPFGKLRAGSLRKGEVLVSPFEKGD